METESLHQKWAMVLVPVIVSALVSFAVAVFTLHIFPLWRRWLLTRELSIIADPVHDGLSRFRVQNASFWTIRGATLYIWLEIEHQDVVPTPAGVRAHIEAHRFVPLGGDQLCWSVRFPTPNPMKVDILAKELQPFSPCRIESIIVIPSEEGWPVAARPDLPSPPHARVLLKKKVYRGMLMLVSEDTDARYFSVLIDPSSASTPCLITPIKKGVARQYIRLFEETHRSIGVESDQSTV